ncbi:MAG: UDP-N-acetylmuramoyl-tripeptide--D-alanyl-D-alanine ligase [Gammaproteobacteria bacterium]|nr:UDP-N-acetylmuramoyl-tripeptide--D-alanyl-D-alanine ligase [Gammaproteobacteria bacterium]
MTIAEVLTWTEADLIGGKPTSFISGISTDSRMIKEGELFVAINGQKYDGHNFIHQAINKKAVGVLVSRAWLKRNRPQIASLNKPIMAVDDTILALGKIAKSYRKKFNIPVIAVTGSNGKTTTKDMIAAVLSGGFNILKSYGSFNNHIGVPLSLLKLTSQHQTVVLELGMNHKGEIRYLADIACPTMAVITNVAQAHLEFFNKPSDIVSAKCELLENLRLNDLAIVNADDKKLYGQAKKYTTKLVGFGLNEHCEYYASHVTNKNSGLEFLVNKKHLFRLNILGKHNVYNALAAIAVADYLGIDMGQVKKQLTDFQLAPLRMETIVLNGIQIIADCYNANPQSMEAAIGTLSEIGDKRRKILVFGDMLELGQFSVNFHRQLGEVIAKSEINILVTVGEESKYTAEAVIACGMSKINVLECLDSEETYHVLKGILQPGDMVLLKGSRRVCLEKILENFVKDDRVKKQDAKEEMF